MYLAYSVHVKGMSIMMYHALMIRLSVAGGGNGDDDDGFEVTS